MPAMLIARFDGDVDELKDAYDRAHALIMSRGGAVPMGELRHHCAIGEDGVRPREVVGDVAPFGLRRARGPGGAGCWPTPELGGR